MLSTPCENECWKNDAILRWGGSEKGNLLDLRGSDDSDDENEVFNFDLHSLDLGSVAFFSSAVDGHAAKIFGRSNVREIRGSIQLWQCSKPCREDDIWEAPDGFLFRLTGDSYAPAGTPLSKPPVHFVPMLSGSCMTHSLSVAESFENNHITCRSCAASARPALKLPGGDFSWSDVRTQRARYERWKEIVKLIAGRRSHPLRVVILEIGKIFSSTTSSLKLTLLVLLNPKFKLGTFDSSRDEVDSFVGAKPWRVVRRESEVFSSDVADSSAVTTLVRINEAWPLIDLPNLNKSIDVVQIMMQADEALFSISSQLEVVRADSGQRPGAADSS